MICLALTVAVNLLYSQKRKSDEVNGEDSIAQNGQKEQNGQSEQNGEKEVKKEEEEEEDGTEVSGSMQHLIEA